MLSKKCGGLGLQVLKEQNKAYMMKLEWGLINRRDGLWVKFIRNKYKCREDLLPKLIERQGSNTWQGINNSWKEVEEGCQVDRSVKE